MQAVSTIAEVREQVRQWRREGLTIGLVPTMGYLHEGHKSLIVRAAAENDRVVVSDFVNPTQFGPTEDLESYPRDFDRDCKLCEEAGAALVFHPEPSEMYAPNACTYVNMDELTHELCGLTRPIHFRGVCTVVSKLFNIVTPDRAYFGQKDAQQLAVIRRMVRDLNFGIQIVGCPIIREEDGLAKSSRNTYLSAEERQAALCLSRAVFAGQKMVQDGERDAKVVLDAMKAIIEAEPMAKIDYVKMVDFENIVQVEKIESEPVLCAMAVYIGKTRLIDNFIFDPSCNCSGSEAEGHCCCGHCSEKPWPPASPSSAPARWVAPWPATWPPTPHGGRRTSSSRASSAQAPNQRARLPTLPVAARLRLPRKPPGKPSSRLSPRPTVASPRLPPSWRLPQTPVPSTLPERSLPTAREPLRQTCSLPCASAAPRSAQPTPSTP
mgnify:CR=1 FL=1